MKEDKNFIFPFLTIQLKEFHAAKSGKYWRTNMGTSANTHLENTCILHVSKYKDGKIQLKKKMHVSLANDSRSGNTFNKRDIYSLCIKQIIKMMLLI
jgi:hypothetical protein